MTSPRERAIGQARADLAQLPDLVAELARLVADRNHDVSGYTGKIVGSPAPLQLPVVHLADTRHKPGWDGADPRHERVAERYGVAPALETWTRVVAEEMPEMPELTEHATVRSEAAVLLEHWGWIGEQAWAEELAADVSRLAADVRAVLGIRPEYRPRCRSCRNIVLPVDADRRLTTWEACAYGACTGCEWTYPPGPALEALAQVQEPMTLTEIAKVTSIPVKTLHRWDSDGLIAATDDRKRNRRFDLAAVNAVARHTFGRQTA